MNCKKCGQPLNGATVCKNCGTSIGYVVNDPVGHNLGSNNNSNGYVQNSITKGYVSLNNVPSGFGFGVSEPSDGAFNKNYGSGYSSDYVDLMKGMDVANVNVVGEPKKTKIPQKKKNPNIREYRPLHKIEEIEMDTGAPTLVNFNTSTSSFEPGERTTFVNDIEPDEFGNVENDIVINEKRKVGKGMEMELPDEKKSMKIWLIAAAVVLTVIVIGVYILPLFTDINYSKYEDKNFVIKYKKDWIMQSDQTSKNTTFLYKDTNYKIIINGVTTFSEMKFNLATASDRKLLYKAFYDSWRNVSGGKLTGGTGTFIDLEEDESMYAKIDYQLDDNQGVGSFYVVVCEKYDLVLSFMTYCVEADKEVFEEKVLEFINGIDYMGDTAQEKEQKEYLSFAAGKTKSYSAGSLINYVMPDSWILDTLRTASVGNQYNIFQFKDGLSLLEIKAYAGIYTYEGMKSSAISNFGAIKSESRMTINGKVWFVIVTPEYDSGGYTYHNELYFTMSTGNNYIYYVQAYICSETDNDTVKRKYFDDSVKYVLEKMTLNNVNN